ncbi:MAG: GAF domain-containing protein, partial [Actinobacteria bacterium]|nr:GAF domain-containing protein [Actinomycetota bacterium]
MGSLAQCAVNPRCRRPRPPTPGSPRGTASVQGYDLAVDPTPRSDANLAMEFASIARTLGSAPTVEATLERIVVAAIEAVDACRHAGIFLLDDGTIRTVAASDATVERLDALQRETNEGPCLDAVRGRTAYETSVDLADEPNYPAFGPRAADLGIRSVLALRLATDQRLGALNLYAELP